MRTVPTKRNVMDPISLILKSREARRNSAKHESPWKTLRDAEGRTDILVPARCVCRVDDWYGGKGKKSICQDYAPSVVGVPQGAEWWCKNCRHDPECHGTNRNEWSKPE